MTSRSEPAGVSRRDFIPSAATTAAAFTVVPRHVLGGPGYKPPSDKLNIAGAGVGGVCKAYLKGVGSENIVALCDVDDEYAAPVFKTYPGARTHRDFRRMLETQKDIDAVVIGTPDHTHAVIAMTAMRLGKHVYCAKPLTRTVGEARALARAARQMKVATQMSVQSCASENAAAACDWIHAGVIGAVREVHVWSDRPIWPQGCLRPTDAPPVPSTLDWDLWLGPAPYRPYHPAYHPFCFRGWWDFGTGALGDMGCHTLHVIVRALDLGPPARVHASGSKRVRLEKPRVIPTPESAPAAAMVTWDFPARGSLPPVRVTWYDGGLKPPRPPELEPERSLGADGILFIGEKGTILSRFTGGPALIPASRMVNFQPPPARFPRTTGHYKEWIEACKGGQPANCHFEFGAHLTELTLLGNIAVRTGKLLAWDGEAMRFTNEPEANAYLQVPCRTGWSL